MVWFDLCLDPEVTKEVQLIQACQNGVSTASALSVWWTDFNGELRAPHDVKREGEDRKMSMTFPRVQPHLRCGKWWLGTLHPPSPLCVAGVHWRPAARAANDPRKRLGSIEGQRGMQGNICGLRKGTDVPFPPPSVDGRRCHASSVVGCLLSRRELSRKRRSQGRG